MVSLLTNASAMSALRVLSGNERALGAVQRQVSTGLRVSDASDDATYWAIGVTMRSQSAGISAVQDSLSLTRSIADVAAAALTSIIGMVRAMETDVVSASQPGVDSAAVQRSIAAKQKAILSTALSASFNGVNWLAVDQPYAVTERLTTTSTHSASASDAFRLSGTGIASTDMTDHVSDRIEDIITVAGPDGRTNEIVSRFARDYLQAKTAGSTTSTVVDNLDTFRVDPGTPLGAAPIGLGPAGYGASGSVPLMSEDLSIYDVGYVTDSTWDLDQTYAGVSSHDRYTSTDRRFFHSDATEAAVAASVPGSLLSPLLGLDVTSAATPDANADVVATTLTALTTKAAMVGSVQTRISIQQSFNAALSDAITRGVGSLVDADLNVASTRLQAIQVQHRLAVEALSIANDNARSVTKLFAM